MPLLQESTPKRDMLTKVDSEEKTPLTSVPYPSLFTPSQLLMASQLMAASRLTLPTSPAFFHPGLLPLAWPPNSPPSPSTTPDPLTSPLKSRKLNNNNVVSSSSEPLLNQNKGTIKRKSWKNQDEDTPSPTSSVSPPSSTDVKDASRDRPFTCQRCNRSFGYKHVLQNHERTHTGEKPFQCPECQKKFTRDHHLKTHMRLHTGERPYRCDHCDRQFVQVANLRRHLRVHTGERPYSCNHCTAKFSDSNQLKAHILIHTNEKPFECDRCHFRFRRRHHLLHHKCGSLEEESTPDSEAEDEPRRRRLHPPSVPIVTLPLRVTLPEQTEPEDLSMTTGLHSNSHGDHLHSCGESPMSRSPSSREGLDEEDFDPHETALFLKGVHS